MTPVERVADSLKNEAKRLCPTAFVNTVSESDKLANVYIYAPRKYADMLQDRLKSLRTQIFKTTTGTMDVRILMDDLENVPAALKEKMAKEQR